MLREVAEYPNSFGPLAPGDERIDTGRYTLCMGPVSTWNTVQRQRFELEELDDALLERGLMPDKDPYAVALVLTHEPPPAAAGLAARRIETLEEFEAANEVQWEAFGSTDAEIAEARALLPQRFREGVNLRHAVWLEGELVCTGTSAPTEHGLLLYGGATHPRARGRGAYRALLRARWDDAVARGTPALITQGGSMSRKLRRRHPRHHRHATVSFRPTKWEERTTWVSRLRQTRAAVLPLLAVPATGEGLFEPVG